MDNKNKKAMLDLLLLNIQIETKRSPGVARIMKKLFRQYDSKVSPTTGQKNELNQLKAS